MKFNASKCQIIRIHRSIKPLERFFILSRQVLAIVDKVKLPWIMKNIDCIPHIVTKANRCLGFIKRKISNYPQKFREFKGKCGTNLGKRLDGVK